MRDRRAALCSFRSLRLGVSTRVNARSAAGAADHDRVHHIEPRVLLQESSAEIDSVGSSSMDSVCDEGDLDLSADTWASSDIATFLAAPPLEGFDDDDDSAMLS